MKMIRSLATFVACGVVVALCGHTSPAQQPDRLDRTVLPIAEPKRETITEIDARKAKAPPRFEVKAPAKAPNVVIVLIDDIGFGHSSAFGGPCQMPTLDRLAAGGLKYNRFHTTALCSPTRTALLTGRNHHVNNAGAIMELATAFPGNTGVRPDSVAPLAQTLRLNGYSTAAFGKYHETAPWEVSVSGPYDRWPTLSGFDKFYGFIGGQTNQWSPADTGTPVLEDYVNKMPFKFTGELKKVVIELGKSGLGAADEQKLEVARKLAGIHDHRAALGHHGRVDGRLHVGRRLSTRLAQPASSWAALPSPTI